MSTGDDYWSLINFDNRNKSRLSRLTGFVILALFTLFKSNLVLDILIIIVIWIFTNLVELARFQLSLHLFNLFDLGIVLRMVLSAKPFAMSKEPICFQE